MKKIEIHLKFYNYTNLEREKYNKKLYDRRLSKGDIRKIESKFAFKKNHLLLNIH